MGKVTDLRDIEKSLIGNGILCKPVSAPMLIWEKWVKEQSSSQCRCERANISECFSLILRYY
jgi:hypothetical protein